MDKKLYLFVATYGSEKILYVELLAEYFFRWKAVATAKLKADNDSRQWGSVYTLDRCRVFRPGHSWQVCDAALAENALLERPLPAIVAPPMGDPYMAGERSFAIMFGISNFHVGEISAVPQGFSGPIPYELVDRWFRRAASEG